MWSGNASATWQIIKGLTFKTRDYNTTNNRTDIFYKDGSKEAYRNGQNLMDAPKWTYDGQTPTTLLGNRR